jgi:glycosyltransferase involved in cell wall biosynthesis
MTFGSLQIAIPVYNEAGNIAQTLGQIETMVTVPHRILIIYDFDEDDTIPVVKGLISKRKAENIFLVKNKYGKGALNAIKTGFDSIEDGVILVVMADSSDDMSIVDAMFAKINQGYDVVCGSRYMRGGRQIGGPKFKKFLSRTADISLHLITGIPTHDTTNSFKMYRKSLLDAIKIESHGGFEIGMEIVIRAFLQGYKISEIPSIWRDRNAGKSRFKFRQWLPGYIRWYLYAIVGRFKKIRVLPAFPI